MRTLLHLALFCLLSAQMAAPAVAQLFPLAVRLSAVRIPGGSKTVLDKTMNIASWAQLDSIVLGNNIPLDAEELADLHLSGDNTKSSVTYTNPAGTDEYIVTVRRVLAANAISDGFFPLSVRVTIVYPAVSPQPQIDKTLNLDSWEDLDAFIMLHQVPLAPAEIKSLRLQGNKTKITIIHTNPQGMDEVKVSLQRIEADDSQWVPVSTSTIHSTRSDGN